MHSRWAARTMWKWTNERLIICNESCCTVMHSDYILANGKNIIWIFCVWEFTRIVCSRGNWTMCDIVCVKIWCVFMFNVYELLERHLQPVDLFSFSLQQTESIAVRIVSELMQLHWLFHVSLVRTVMQSMCVCINVLLRLQSKCQFTALRLLWYTYWTFCYRCFGFFLLFNVC